VICRTLADTQGRLGVPLARSYLSHKKWGEMYGVKGAYKGGARMETLWQW